MIIGKSLTALSGGLKPEIIVTAKAGSLLNLHFKDSPIILQSYQLGAEETTYTFIVSVSETAYVVEDATNSASVEVLVDVVAQYSIKIPYVLWIYKDGDGCDPVTGGWAINDSMATGRPVTGTAILNDSGTQYINAPGYTDASLRTKNKINVSDYSIMAVEFTAITGLDFVGLISTYSTSDVSTPVARIEVVSAGTAFADISDVTGSYYIVHRTGGGRGGRVSKIWLE